MRQLRKTTAIPLVLVLALLSMNATCDKYRKAGQLARDFAAGVSAFEDAEITLHQTGRVSDDEHRQIQMWVLQVAQAGKTLDQAINDTHNATNAKTSLDAAATALAGLLSSGVLQVKNPDSKAALQASVFTLKLIIDNIAAIGGQ